MVALIFEQFGDPVGVREDGGEDVVGHGHDVRLPRVGHRHVTRAKFWYIAHDRVEADADKVEPLECFCRQKHGPPHQPKHNLCICHLLYLIRFAIHWVKVQLGESRPQFFDEGFPHIICQYDLHADSPFLG